ncbi:kallikrein-11 isoform X1 [Pan paniscus]|uniref:kallikrein-11 isoform X1 n=1 Tax=Pan paniscus TaxID=9597 RepID=UPI002436B3E6|nr:kallikrein-11 isoform X1 [Pan paniscus]
MTHRTRHRFRDSGQGKEGCRQTDRQREAETQGEEGLGEVAQAGSQCLRGLRGGPSHTPRPGALRQGLEASHPGPARGRPPASPPAWCLAPGAPTQPTCYSRRHCRLCHHWAPRAPAPEPTSKAPYRSAVKTMKKGWLRNGVWFPLSFHPKLLGPGQLSRGTWGPLLPPPGHEDSAVNPACSGNRACRGRDQDHQGVRVQASLPALAGSPVREDAAALWGDAHRPQMAPDSSPLPQAYACLTPCDAPTSPSLSTRSVRTPTPATSQTPWCVPACGKGARTPARVTPGALWSVMSLFKALSPGARIHVRSPESLVSTRKSANMWTGSRRR